MTCPGASKIRKSCLQSSSHVSIILWYSEIKELLGFIGASISTLVDILKVKKSYFSNSIWSMAAGLAKKSWLLMYDL